MCDSTCIRRLADGQPQRASTAGHPFDQSRNRQNVIVGGSECGVRTSPLSLPANGVVD